MYFCDPTAQSWQEAQYEHAHAAIQQLHAEHNVPYLYVEWREALRALHLAEPSPISSDHRFRLPVAITK